MVKELLLSLFVASALAGCGSRSDAELATIEPAVDKAISQLGAMGVRNQWDDYMRLFQATTNRELRAKYSRLCRQKLLAVEISGDDYGAQSRVFNRVADGLSPNPASLATQRWTIVDDCAAHIEKLKWMRRQLDKWKAVSGGRAEKLRADSPDKLKEWRKAYGWCLDRYETDLNTLEGGFDFMCKVLRASDDERCRAKSLLEKYYDRPLRTKEEVDSIRHRGAKSAEKSALTSFDQE